MKMRGVGIGEASNIDDLRTTGDCVFNLPHLRVNRTDRPTLLELFDVLDVDGTVTVRPDVPGQSSGTNLTEAAEMIDKLSFSWKQLKTVALYNYKSWWNLCPILRTMLGLGLCPMFPLFCKIQVATVVVIMLSLTMFCAKGIWESWMVDAMSSASNFFGLQSCLLFSLGALEGMCGRVLDLEWNTKSRTWCGLLLEMYQWGLYGAKFLRLFVYFTKPDEWIGIIHTQQPLHETLHILARKLAVDILSKCLS